MSERSGPPAPGLPFGFVVAARSEVRAASARSRLAWLGATDVVVVVGAPSMSAAYEDGARRTRHEALCFLHDDVELAGFDAAAVAALVADPRCGFLGVAGTRLLDASGMWFSGIEAPAELWRFSGRCGQLVDGRRIVRNYGPFGEVVALDGVCLFTSRRTLATIGGWADAAVEGFDFYDASATLRAHLAGLVNRTVRVDLYHESTGMPRRPGFEDARLRFVARWGRHLPRGVAGGTGAGDRPRAFTAFTGSMAPPRDVVNEEERHPMPPTAMAQPPADPRGANAATSDDARPEPLFELTASRQLVSWLVEQQVSLALTTYQAGKLILLGVQPDGQLSVCERTFPRCMGLAADEQTLWMAALWQLWRFENILPAGAASSDGFDRVYVPQLATTTGDVDVHDLAVDRDGRLVFVNTLFSCLATTSDTHNFVPLWQPPFVSRLAAEDRCHMNGLAMRDGRPAFVTCVSRSDVADGWRDRRRDGGVVVDVGSREIVAGGLSMPHSPRWYRDRLWLLQSGTGHFGWVDLASGRFEPVAFCPGYLRGLSFVGDFAVVGSSRARENRTFSGLELDDNLKAHDAEARCGLYVIDLRSGDLVHSVRIQGIVDELYDVVAIPGVRRPKVLGVVKDEIRRTISIGPAGAL
jgi:uncharacterized protein (TIGR03032 family)